MQHGFGSHPAVASQYLNFLVDSRGKDTDQNESKMSKAITKLETRLDSIEKIAKEAVNDNHELDNK